MTDSPTSKMRFKTPAKLALEAAFDGGRLTSDGGLLWISEVDSELGVCEAMAEHILEWRRMTNLYTQRRTLSLWARYSSPKVRSR